MPLFGLRAEKKQDGLPKFNSEILKISISKIRPCSFQGRRNFDEEGMRELANSIEQNGLLQPISVIKSGMDYMLIAGERRLRACKMLGMKSIPAILYTVSKEEIATLSYLENSERHDLSPFEQAIAIKRYIDTFNFTQSEAAQRLNMTQGALANKLRLLSLTPNQMEICIANRLSERHARAMLRLNGEVTQTSFLETVVAKKLNVKEAERLVERYLSTPVLQKKKSVPVVRDVRLFLNTINRAIDIMKSSGIDAETIKTQDDDYIQYIVKIPIAKTDS